MGVHSPEENSRYFDVDVGPNAESLIRHLSISVRGEYLGQSFQGHAAVRAITPADHQLLASVASGLPLLERVGIYPEDEFEARLLVGEGARELMVREDSANYSLRMRYLFETVDSHRARRNVEQLHELYDGRCQLCLFDPCDQYGFRLCHGHHIHWLSRGGEDDLSNIILVCPNHHAAIHRDDAAFDYSNLSFRFSSRRIEAVSVRINSHLPKALR